MNGINLQQEERLDIWTIMAANSFKDGLNERIKTLNIDLNFDMYMLLTTLLQQDGQNRKNLGLMLRKSPGSVSNTANALVQKKMLNVKKSGRERRYYLTPEGRRVQTEIFSAGVEVMENAFVNISKDERAVAVGVLKRVFLNLQMEELKV